MPYDLEGFVFLDGGKIGRILFGTNWVDDTLVCLFGFWLVLLSFLPFLGGMDLVDD